MAAELPPDSPRVAVITVSYASDAVLGPFLESLPKAVSEPTIVVVVDNKPAESVERLVRAHGAEYLALPGNPGYGGGANAAARSLPASVEWVLVSNPDIHWHPGAIDTLLATARTDDTIGSVGPMVLNDDGTIYPSARAVPSLRTGVGHALFANVWLGNPWTRAYRAEHTDPGVRRDAGWLSGSCVLVRRDAFDRLEGFDEEYFMYFEDVDLGYRLGKAGFRNVYEPRAVVTHSGAHSTAGESERMVSAHHESARRFLRRKYPGVILWPVRVALGIGLALRSALLRRRVERMPAPRETPLDAPSQDDSAR